MDTTEFQKQWGHLSDQMRFALRNFARCPTESNRSYIVGYIGALADHGMIQDAAYWLAVAGVMAQGHTAQEAVLHAMAGWVAVDVQAPTKSDGNSNGDVLFLRSGREMLGRVHSGVPVDATHWRRAD